MISLTNAHPDSMTNASLNGAATGGATFDPVGLYRTMLLARTLNETLKARKTQGKFPFYIGCGGHESIAAVVAALQHEDWLALYYRDLAGWLQWTGDLHAPIREAYGRATDPMSHGRNMPGHHSSPRHHVLPTMSEVAGLGPFAGGVAWALKRNGNNNIIAFFTGEGSVATNDFNVLLRQATVHKLPVLIVVENNHWAITTEEQIQWAGDLVAQVRAMNALAEDVDGVDPFAVFAATQNLVAQLRSGKGPALLHLHLGLLDPHSSSTDMYRYRTREEIQETRRSKDPITRMEHLLIERGLLSEADLPALRKAAKAQIDDAEAQVVAEPQPTPDRVTASVLTIPAYRQQESPGPTTHMLMLDAINDALVELVKRDPGFFVYGQDVGSPTGGVFGATARLVKEYPGTAISSPLNEQLIVGIAAGCGLADGRARCGEIQFADYHQSATQTIRLAARMSYQTCGEWSCPLVLRMKSGSGGGGPISDAGSGGGGFGHSNAGEQWFTNVPGLITVCPATPYDAKGLLIQASLSQSPVVFLERGRLYRADVPRVHKGGAIIQALAPFWEVPAGYYTEPIGKARRIRIGSGASVASIVTWGTLVLEGAIAAARFVEEGGGAVDLVDLRTLMPFDREAIQASVRETNRVIVVTEEPDFTSFGRHMHSWISQELHYDLDPAPLLISAVAGPAAPYGAIEESAFFPTADDIQRGLERLTTE